MKMTIETKFPVWYVLVLFVFANCGKSNEQIKTALDFDVKDEIKKRQAGVPPEPNPPEEENRWIIPTDPHGHEPTEDGSTQCQTYYSEDGAEPEIEPIEMGGFIVSEFTMTYLANIKLNYKEIRKLYLVDIEGYTKKEGELREALLKSTDEITNLENKRNSWWSQNKLTIGLVVGFVVGVGATALVVYAVK